MDEGRGCLACALPRRNGAGLAIDRDSAHHPAGRRRGRDGGFGMKVHAPSETVFWAAAAMLILALFGHFVPDMGFLTQYQFWFAVASAAVMLLGCVV